MLSSRMSRSELSSQGPAASMPWATASHGSVGKDCVGGNLLLDEASVRRVAVERVDQVVAIWPGVRPDPVLIVAVGLGEMNQVHPVPRPPFAKVRAGEQAVDQAFVGVGRSIREKARDILGRRGQAEQIKREPANQRAAVGLGGGRETFFRELGQDEGVDRVPGPIGRCRVGRMEPTVARRA